MVEKRVIRTPVPPVPHPDNRGHQNPTPNRGVGTHPAGPKKP